MYCPGMKVHGVNTERVEEAVYLGDIIRQDGKNTSNIKSRVKENYEHSEGCFIWGKVL